MFCVRRRAKRRARICAGRVDRSGPELRIGVAGALRLGFQIAAVSGLKIIHRPTARDRLRIQGREWLKIPQRKVEFRLAARRGRKRTGAH